MFSILNVLQGICAKSLSFSESIACLYWDSYSDKTSKSFDIVIVASDLGKNSLKSKATVLINLIDVNDNKPKIIEPENDQTFFIDENNNNNLMIYQVKAIDPYYSHNRIVYQLDQDLNQDCR